MFDSRRRRFLFYFFQLALTFKTLLRFFFSFFPKASRVFYYISLFDVVARRVSGGNWWRQNVA
jgi:hypothetical protein